MKRIVCIFLVLLILAGCAVQSVETYPYIITRKTGVYESFDADDYSETVEKGEQLRLIHDTFAESCKTKDVYGTKIGICKVVLKSTGKTAWILQNAIE
jgi:hypothetical protein